MKSAEVTLEEAPRQVHVGNGCLNQGELEALERIYERAIKRDPFNNVELETAGYGGASLS